MSQPCLLDQLRDGLRVRHYSLRTEKAYVHWCKRYILFHGKRHPRDLGSEHINSFLTFLAVERMVAKSRQNQALEAILFLYKRILIKELDWVDGVVRAKRPKRLPVVLSREKMSQPLGTLPDPHRPLAKLLYGTGMRLMEGVRLRVNDVDCGGKKLLVRAAG